MKKVFLMLAMVLSIQLLNAQQSVRTEMPQRLLNQGREMFLDANYTGAINTLEHFKQLVGKDSKDIEDADYMIVSSMFYQGESDSDVSLKSFLEEYPSSHHSSQILFLIGSKHFANKEWDKAAYWLMQSNVEHLNTHEQEALTYRLAYSHMQTGNLKTAKGMFQYLQRTSSKYKTPASYYVASIAFNDGEYKEALPIFKELKDKPEYKENANFFLLQGTYMENNPEKVISEGKKYLSSYPQNENIPELYRMLGNSYYRTGDISQSIDYYEKYMQLESKPLREDMYQLAETYYRNGNYTKTMEALKLVASRSDELGQKANMLLGQSYLQLNDTPGALLAFDAAAKSEFSPQVSEEAQYNYVMLMNKESATSTFGESITALQNFLAKYPNSKYTNQVNNILANTLLTVKNYDMALKIINSIRNPGAKILEAKQVVLYQLGVQQSVDGKYSDAVKNLTSSIEMGNYDINVRNEAYFWRGDAYYKGGDYSQASRDYSSYISQTSFAQSNYALALYNLGYADFQTKNYNQALSNFRKYLAAEQNKSSTTYADAQNRIGDCYLYSRNFSEAEKYYAQAVNNNPNNADYSEFQKAFVLGLQHSYNEKVNALDNMMNKYPNSEYYESALFEKSRALAMQNKERQAIETLEKLFRERPRTNLGAKAGVLLGQMYFNVNNPQKSIEAYKQVVASYPSTEDARTALNNMEGVYRDVNDIGGYANYLNKIGRGNTLSVTRQDSLTFLAAENIYMKQNKASAKNAFTNYLTVYPKGVFASDANYYLGRIAFDAKDTSAAMEHLGNVIVSNNPKYIDDALIYVSGIQFEKKDYESAYNTYEHLSLSGTSADNKHIGQLGMLRCAYLTNKDDEVVDAANKLVRNSNISTDVFNEAVFYRGRSLYRLKKEEQAINDLKVAAKETRTVFGSEAQFILADIYYKQKAYDKVEKQVMEFMKIGTTHEYWMARAIIVLSDSYRDNGDAFQSRQYLESLQDNFKTTDVEIKKMISDRLNKLNNQ